MSTTSTPEPKFAPEDLPTATIPRWVVVLLVVIVVAVVYVAYAQRSSRGQLSAQLEQVRNQLTRLEARAATLEGDYADLRAQLDVSSEKLGLTRQEIARARDLAAQIKKEQQAAVAQLDTQLETLRSTQETRFGSLTGEVSTVRGDMEATRRALADTQMKLERTIGDLGVQSGLIAKNREELEELKRRGERDYFEFDIRKSKEYTRVGSISVRLNKTDTKRQKYTLTLLANDKRIEKKDKTLLEPVQFYLQGTRHLLEIVVYDIQKDRAVGYLSAPKELASR